MIFSVVAATFSGQAADAQVALRVESAKGADINIDGQLSEWKQIRFASYGSGARVALAHNDKGLFVAAEIDDERIIASGRCGTGSDAVVLSVRRPEQGAPASQLWLCPGEQRQAASATMRSGKSFRRATGSNVVEMKREGGYALEAFVPWRAFADGRYWEQYEGVVGVHDVDSELKAEPNVVGRVPNMSGTSFSGPPLLDVHFLGGTDGLLFSFLQHQGSAAGTAVLDRWANVHGSAELERIVVSANRLLVMGPGYRGGENYDVMELPIERGSDLLKAEFVDVTQDGRADVLLWLRQSAGADSRVVVTVYRFSGKPFDKILSLEVQRQSATKTLACELVLPRKKGHALAQPACEVNGFGAADYRRWRGSDAIEIIKPWEGGLSRTLSWHDGGFRVADKSTDPPVAGASEAKKPSAASAVQGPAVADKPLRVQDLVKAFKDAAGLKASTRPDDTVRFDVVGDGRAETVVRFGQHVAVMGEGYLEGRRWFHYGIPVQAASDVRSVRVADVTGNGKGELIFEYVQRIGDVERVLLAVHCLGYKGFPRILLVETERRQGKREVRNQVVIRGKGSGSLRVLPGKAKGWNRDSWTFADNADEVGPLLLPWRDKPAQYRFVQNQGLVRQ